MRLRTLYAESYVIVHYKCIKFLSGIFENITESVGLVFVLSIQLKKLGSPRCRTLAKGCFYSIALPTRSGAKLVLKHWVLRKICIVQFFHPQDHGQLNPSNTPTLSTFRRNSVLPVVRFYTCFLQHVLFALFFSLLFVLFFLIIYPQDHGLLSAQLHPDFPLEPYLFLFYSVAPKNW